jgi:hypothetical protein
MWTITTLIKRARFAKKAVIAAAVLASVAGGVATGSATAYAATATAHGSPAHVVVAPTQVVRAQLTLDCVHMSVRARLYANAHHYCDATRSGSAVPDSTGYAYGDCGSSFISIVNEGGGYARFSWGFSSSQGTVAHRNLVLSWVNERFGNNGNIPDGSFMWSSGYSSTPQTRATGEGNVFGDVSGYVVLWWGATCDLLSPETTQAITL